MADSIQEYFADLPDPRRAQGRRHRLSDLIVIAVTAVICCADTWADVADFGHAKLKWFQTFLELPHGMPCPDTFERVFARLDPDAFERCFMNWTKALAGSSQGKLLAIDGKKIRRSFQHAWDHSTATHLVSAFVAQNRTVLGQLAVECKENQIIAIPKLLELLDLTGATVTIDAMGCQTKIAEKIVQNGGDYVLAVKDNQPALHDRIQRNINDLMLEKFQGVRHGHHQTVDADHGRIETRDVWVTDELFWLVAGEILSTMSSICHVGLECAEAAPCHFHRTTQGIDRARSAPDSTPYEFPIPSHSSCSFHAIASSPSPRTVTVTAPDYYNVVRRKNARRDSLDACRGPVLPIAWCELVSQINPVNYRFQIQNTGLFRENTQLKRSLAIGPKLHKL